MIGLADVKTAIRNIAQAIEMQKKREDKGLKGQQQAIHIVFTGNPGTGKTTVARRLGQLFLAMGLLPSDKIVETDRAGMVASYVGQTAPQVNAVCDKAMGGILFIDEAYTLAGTGGSDSFGQEAIDTLLKRMEDDRGKFVVIAAGYEKEMQWFIEANSGLKSRFTHFLHLADYKPDELYAIFASMAKGNGYTLSAEAQETAKAAIVDIHRNKGKEFANGRTMRNLFDDTIRRMGSRLAAGAEEQTEEMLTLIHAGDIPYEKKKEQTVEEILAELDKMIGLNSVKKAVREIANTIMVANERAEQSGGEAQKQAVHFVFTGNPGTGKTTVARKMGALFKAMKLLPTDKLIETDRAGMVAGYVGQTSPQVNALCDRAMGGILFIDEAYTLKQNDSDTFGQEAIDTLLARMENDRGKYVVIVAGYKNEMDTFIKSNPGLPSRFTHTLHLEDYIPDELYAIFSSMVKAKGYVLTPEAQKAAKAAIEDIERNKGRDFANGRTMRKLFEDTERKQGSRLASVSKEERAAVLNTIEAEDIPYEKPKAPPTVDEILAGIDSMIGLKEVKTAIRELANNIKLQKDREAMGMKGDNPAIHIVFIGNPGTGKTTVARKLGALFKAMGLLPTDKIVETDRSGLVAAYVGQTAPLVNEMCDKAAGGILFIDEAYTLSIGGDQFGQEAINTLLKRMEDDRGKYVVIAAGYEKEMGQFLETNTGLKSRFTHTLHLTDYEPEDLFKIYSSMANGKGYQFTPDAEAAAKTVIAGIHRNRSADFANGRTMRNLFEDTVRRMGSRLAALPAGAPKTEALLATIEAEDIQKEGEA
jgi:SpoVK/Ycf46/Vps4 family AAA+-type ATPase